MCVYLFLSLSIYIYTYMYIYIYSYTYTHIHPSIVERGAARAVLRRDPHLHRHDEEGRAMRSGKGMSVYHIIA